MWFDLDDLTFVVTHFLPHLNRDSIWRMLKAEGLNRRPAPVSPRPAKGKGTFKEYDLGFIHSDIKHLPTRQTSNGAKRNAISRWPLIGIRARYTEPLRMTRPRSAQSSCGGRPLRPFRFVSPPC
jgi:hypothetical protein